MDNEYSVRSEAFVGVADYYEEGDYFTSSGNEITYTNWADGEPDNKVLLSVILSHYWSSFLSSVNFI